VAVIAVGVAEDGSEIRASVNDTIALRLPENPTSGVRWAFERLEGPVRLARDEYEPLAGGGIGAAAVRILTLQPLAPGKIHLKLKRLQEWEGPSTIDATFSCSVRVERGDS
jgi:inhibitor of cysteine peptidase